MISFVNIGKSSRTAYRFVTNQQQAKKLINDVEKDKNLVGEIIFIDSLLITKLSTGRCLIALTQQARLRRLNLIFIGHEDSPIDWRLKYSIDSRISFSLINHNNKVFKGVI